MRDQVLQILKDKHFDKLFDLLRNDKVFNELISDPIFTNVFGTFFIDELLLTFPEELKYPIFLFQSHKSPNSKYILNIF